MEVGPPSEVGPSTLFETGFLFLLFTATYAKQADLEASGNSPVSTSPFVLGTLGLKMCPVASGFTWVLEVGSQDPKLAEKASYPLNHLCSSKAFKKNKT